MSKLISGKSEGGKNGLFFFLKFVFQILTLKIKDQKKKIILFLKQITIFFLTYDSGKKVQLPKPSFALDLY